MTGKLLRVVISLSVVPAVVLVVFLGCKEKESSRPVPGAVTSPVSADNEIRLLKEILKDDPENLNALIKLGNMLMDARRFNEAVDAYRKALDIDPSNVNVRVDMGTSYRYSGMPQKAVEEFRKAVKTDPKHAYAHLNLGVVLAFDLGDTKGGIGEFETFLKLAPNDPRAAEVREEIKRLKAAGK